MATGTDKSPKVIEFSSSGADSGITSFFKGFYDPNTRTVRIFVSARSSSNMATSTVLATVPQAYRPSANTNNIVGMIATSSSVGAYQGVVRTDGTISQLFTNSAREVFLCGEYSI